MKDLLWSALEQAENLSEIKKTIVEILAHVRRGSNKVGYIAGIIGSDGEEHIERNFRRIGEYSVLIRERHGIPVISATEVFPPELLKRVRAGGVSREDFELFWRSILSCGHITDLFMTPRWEQSRGAIDEFETGRKLGLRIHYL